MNFQNTDKNMEYQDTAKLYEFLREATKTFNGRVWARQFLEVAKKMPHSEITEDFMEAWFCNAIMTGYDAGFEAAQKH